MPANNPAKPLPFPGESPTVSLAMAAGEKYGFHEEETPQRPSARTKSAKPSKSAKPRKAAKRATAKKTPARKSTGARKPR